MRTDDTIREMLQIFVMDDTSLAHNSYLASSATISNVPSHPCKAIRPNNYPHSGFPGGPTPMIKIPAKSFGRAWATIRNPWGVGDRNSLDSGEVLHSRL